MESKVIYYKDRERDAVSRVFRFVDQTDRSQKAVREHKTLVRSHVMTEIRRQKRSKVRLEPETDLQFHDSREGTVDLSPDKSNRISLRVPPYIFDHIIKADSTPENLSPEWNRGNERQQARATSHSTCNMPYSSHLKAVRRNTSRSRVPYDGLQARILDLRPTWTQGTSTLAEVRLNTSSGYELPQKYHPTEEISDRISDRSCLINTSPAILGASRVDPFRALPISANRDVYELVDNYTVAIPVLMYGTRTRNPVHLRLYDVATNDPAAFHSMLAYSARQLDSMTSSQTSTRALKYSSATLRLIYERLKDPSFGCGDGLVMAVALLAFTERRFGDKMIAQKHWLALREILKSRGGIEALNINRWLAAVLYWNSLVWSSNSNDGNAVQIKWPSLVVDNEPVTALPAKVELSNFLISLASVKSRLLDHARTGCSASCLPSCSRRRTVFDRNGPLYKIVSKTRLHELFDDDNAAVAANIQRRTSACQTPCLLYLNIVMIEYEGSTELMEQFLGNLIVCIYKDSLDMDVSAEHLLIRLLSGLEDTTFELTCRAHKTIRLANVIQKLGARSQQSIHSALIEALVYPGINELAPSNGLLSAIAESLAGLPRHYCVNDLDRFITALSLS